MFLHSTAGYVPDGMSPDQWKKVKAEEEARNKSKKLGAIGPQGFQSRSLLSFQQDLEKGKVSHLMPMTNAKDKLRKGLIKPEDIPYMQRNGSWDNSDVKGAKKLGWSKTDKQYAEGSGAFASLSLGQGVGGTGKQERRGPQNQKATQSPKSTEGKPKKRLFGLF